MDDTKTSPRSPARSAGGTIRLAGAGRVTAVIVTAMIVTAMIVSI